MYLDEKEIQAQVYAKTEKGVYYAKVSFPSLKLYINSITARKSTKFPDGELWIQMPAFKVGNRWIKPLEFSNDSQLQIIIKDAVLRAVDEYNVMSVYPDAEILDGDLDKQLDDAISKLEKPP